MRFVFEKPRVGDGLPVIPEIPNYRLCTVEGRNGIGKTLAARLLELISGTRPWAALPKAWLSLGSDLGKLTVHIDDFPTGEIIRCELDSATWQGRSEAECAADPGAAFINDKPASWAEVRALLKVRRIAGDEGLSETLGRSLREASVNAFEHYSTADQTAGHIGRGLGQFTSDLAGISHTALEHDRIELIDAIETLGKARQSLKAADKVYKTLNRQVQSDRNFVISLRALPDLIETFRRQFHAYERASSAVSRADLQLTKVGHLQVAAKGKEEEFKKNARLLVYRTRALDKAVIEEQHALIRAGLPERIATEEITGRVAANLKEISDLEAQNKTADVAGEIRNIQEAFMPTLRRVSPSAQGQTIATVDVNVDVSVEQLAEGMSATYQVLREIPKPGDVQEREQKIRDLLALNQRLEALPALFRATDQKAKNLDEVREDLEHLSAATVDQQAALVKAQESVNQARNELIAAAVAVRGTQSAIATHTGGAEPEPFEVDEPDSPDALFEIETNPDIGRPADVETVLAQVHSWLKGAASSTNTTHSGARSMLIADTTGGVVAQIRACAAMVTSQLQNAEETQPKAREAVVAAEASEREAAETYDRAHRAVVGKLALITEAARMLTDSRGPWGSHQAALRQVLERVGVTEADVADLGKNSADLKQVLNRDTGASSTPMLLAKVVDVILQIADLIEEDAVAVRDSWATAAEYLNVTSSILAPRLSDNSYDIGSVKPQSRPALRAWAERHLSHLLSAYELRNELFDGSPAVTFNLNDLTVSWHERTAGDGERLRLRRRPLEAFSSGEQVFAYTRAKLEQLREFRGETANLVVILDEFGAFVARDRFAQLMVYIEHEALGKTADQVVVTVPLSGDLARVAAAAQTANVIPDVFAEPGYVVIPANVK